MSDTTFDNVKNLRMRAKLQRGEAIDVSSCPRTEEGDYVLRDIHGAGPGYTEGADYCDATRELWIWSVGEHWDTGEIRASTEPSGAFYGEREWKCLFLR